MAETRTVTCDRCKATVEAGLTRLTAETGEMRGHDGFKVIDLCPECSRAFMAFVRGALTAV